MAKDRTATATPTGPYPSAPPKKQEQALMPLPEAPPAPETPPVTALMEPTPPSATAQAFLDEVRGPREEPRSIPFVKIDHKNGLFILPNGDCVDSFKAYIVYYFGTRSYYAKSPRAGEKGQPPDCWSPDGIKPSEQSTDKQCATCAACPQNAFGTARDGRSKACATKTWLFLYNPRIFTQVPIGVLVAPSSSLRPLFGTKFEQGYLARCVEKHHVYEIVLTTLRLQKQGDAQSVAYSVLQPEMGPALEQVEQVRKLAQIRNQFVALMADMRGLTPEVAGEGEE